MRKIYYFISIICFSLVFGACSKNISSTDEDDIDEHKPSSVNYIHAISDMSHAFSFYADGRFGQQYLKDFKCYSNAGNLADLDLSNVNLLVFLDCEEKCPYTEKDFAVINNFVNDGGGVVVLGNHDRVAQNKLAQNFGASFEANIIGDLIAKGIDAGKVETQGNATWISFTGSKQWNSYVETVDGKSVLAMSKCGKGNVVIASRSLAGSNPDASDSINSKIWIPVLKAAAAGKVVERDKPFQIKGWEEQGHSVEEFGFTLHYNDYLAPYADAMSKVISRCMPMIEKRMGIPLSSGMATDVALLASGGGGFSSGKLIGLAVFWGGFPEREDPMIEFITHESVHSWVLPYAEIWNEPIATYVGDLVMADMGYEEESARLIAACIERAKSSDPSFSLYDLNGKSVKDGVPDLPSDKVNDVHWGKSFWIFEQLRKENPDFIADYFKAKREYAVEGKIQKYDENNTVAVMSIAMGKDMFPWFRSIGFDVDRNNAEIKF